MNKILSAILAGSLAVTSMTASAADIPSQANRLKQITQEMVAPPMLPRHEQIAKGEAKVVKVELTIEEKSLAIDASGTTVAAMTFNGTIPGPMIVVHQNDYVELTLKNPATNTLTHNIDLHTITGALGGGGLTDVAPGQEVTIRFKATKAGVFVYHCAPGGLMIPYHVVAGMNGAIMVLPRDGLKDEKGNPLEYDKAYYIGEQDFYVPQNADGTYKKYASPADAMGDTLEVMKTNNPSHVVFNGAVGALTGDNALKANVGDRVLFVHSQANRDTRPHIIGGHGDYVWERGNIHQAPQTDLETWFIAGGSAGAALYTFKQPGVYAYVNHNLIDAVLKGAAAHVVVEGDWNNDLLEQLSGPNKEAQTKSH